MFKEFEPIQKSFYKMNHKQKTAGYDKYEFLEMADAQWAIFINKRTKSKNFITVVNNKLSMKTIYFDNVCDYFIFTEKQRENYKNKKGNVIYFYKTSQYYFELQQIQNKYPEYFI